MHKQMQNGNWYCKIAAFTKGTTRTVFKAMLPNEWPQPCRECETASEFWDIVHTRQFAGLRGTGVYRYENGVLQHAQSPSGTTTFSTEPATMVL